MITACAATVNRLRIKPSLEPRRLREHGEGERVEAVLRDEFEVHIREKNFSPRL